MDKTQKYILTGTIAAITIFALIQLFASYSDTTIFWLAAAATLATTMVVLVFNIYNSTKKLVPVRIKAHHDNSHKKH